MKMLVKIYYFNLRSSEGKVYLNAHMTFFIINDVRSRVSRDYNIAIERYSHLWDHC